MWRSAPPTTNEGKCQSKHTVDRLNRSQREFVT